MVVCSSLKWLNWTTANEIAIGLFADHAGWCTIFFERAPTKKS